ncbi:MAG: tripartite tricarboxylate transporter substrate binding protein [Proteobacteria bacterium]|nr:tripartite tricarboxylate transporter substrate binding protein [Pseudomonadota bacterium]
MKNLSKNLTRRGALVVGCALLFADGAARAQAEKPLQLIVPLTAGSAVDGLARALSPELSKILKRPVVVENLPGAGGITGTQRVVTAAKDGNTLGLVASGHVINPFIYKSMPFDSLKDIRPISVIAGSPLVLVVNAEMPARNTKELIALLKTNPEKYNYGSAGNGSVAHLATALFVKEAGVSLRHVPYRGVGPLLTDLIGGQVQLAFIGTSAAKAQIASGKLRAIAVSSAKRTDLMPDVPTLAESGVKDYQYEPWIAVIGPVGLPDAQVNTFAAAFKTAIAAPELRETLTSQGFVTSGTTPAEAKVFFASELKRHEKLAKDSGAVLE